MAGPAPALPAATRLVAVLAAAFVLIAALLHPAAADEPLPFSGGLLWQVEGPGAPPGYVLGTMHVTDPRAHAVLPAVDGLLDRVDSVTLEMEMTALAMARMSAAMFTLSPDLAEALPPEDFAALVDITAGYGLPEVMAARLRPWGAVILLSIPAEEYRRMAAGEVPLDQRLQDEAEARGLAVHGLETVGEQIAALSALPAATELALLRESIASHAALDGLYEQMIGLYAAGDLTGLYLLTLETGGDNPRLIEAFLEHLLYRRNKTMAERMAKRLAEGNALIAIGALHLPGERGVLALLAERGYTVKQVR